MKSTIAKVIVILVLASGWTLQAVEVHVRDVAFILGARENQLYGIGLVTGLANDGDKDPAYTLQAMQNAFQSIGISVPAAQITSKNVAVVLITATLPPNAKNGSKIDVQVAAMGDAKSLQGGLLLQTFLYGPTGDRTPYASAQGRVFVGGFSFGSGGGGGGATVQKNHPTTGQIVGGALVEKTIPSTIVKGDSIYVVLREQDYTSASLMAQAINEKFPNSSIAEDSTTVRVKIPDLYRNGQEVPFVSQVEMVQFSPASPARIIINERTGTIVVSAQTRVSTCAVSHGNIIVKIAETQDVSQPNAFAQTGQTVVTTRADVQVSEDKESGRLKALPDMPTVEKLAYYLNQMGATPRDMMAIFEAMKQAGALQAELVVQ